MARIGKEQEYTKKRNEILAAAQRLVFTKVYKRLTIQDIQAELNISGGAFYLYFDSKPALRGSQRAVRTAASPSWHSRYSPAARAISPPASRTQARYLRVWASSPWLSSSPTRARLALHSYQAPPGSPSARAARRACQNPGVQLTFAQFFQQ
jgi:hypothetical protein